MVFEPLVVLKNSDSLLWVAGAEHESRSDGSGSFMVAPAFSAHADFPELSVLVDEVGQSWVLLEGVREGFSMDGIVLQEKEDFDGGSTE